MAAQTDKQSLALVLDLAGVDVGLRKLGMSFWSCTETRAASLETFLGPDLLPLGRPTALNSDIIFHVEIIQVHEQYTVSESQLHVKHMHQLRSLIWIWLQTSK